MTPVAERPAASRACPAHKKIVIIKVIKLTSLFQNKFFFFSQVENNVSLPLFSHSQFSSSSQGFKPKSLAFSLFSCLIPHFPSCKFNCFFSPSSLLHGTRLNNVGIFENCCLFLVIRLIMIGFWLLDYVNLHFEHDHLEY